MANSFAERLQRLVDKDGRVVINTMFRTYDWQDRTTWPAPDPVERRMAQFRVMRKVDEALVIG
ncbi:hypothetical protein [Pseudomonas sp. Marseille-QA0892]